MKKLLFLSVLSMSTMMLPSVKAKPIVVNTVVTTEKKQEISDNKQSKFETFVELCIGKRAKDLIKENPIKSVITSYLILNLLINRRKSILSHGLDLTLKKLPSQILSDAKISFNATLDYTKYLIHNFSPDFVA